MMILSSIKHKLRSPIIRLLQLGQCWKRSLGKTHFGSNDLSQAEAAQKFKDRHSWKPKLLKAIEILQP